jgi:hypothetical protein
VIGETREKFLREGGVRRLGCPVTDEVPTPDGFGLMTKFERGTVYWYRGHAAEIGTPDPPPRPDRALKLTSENEANARRRGFGERRNQAMVGGYEELEGQSKFEQIRTAIDLVAAVVRQILRVIVGGESRSLIGEIASLQANAP